MEKTLLSTVGAIFITWMGVLTGTKVDKSACEATHKGVCEKLDLIREDVQYIRERIDHHIEKSE